jgi:hypothetical protein
VKRTTPQSEHEAFQSELAVASLVKSLTGREMGR